MKEQNNQDKKEAKINQEANFKKYIRPGILIFFVILYTILLFIDGNLLNIKEIYVKTLADILNVSVIWYFTSRGVEKIMGTKME